MNCSFAEKVSTLIDGELSESESRQVRRHVADCAECQNLEKDFLFFREQVKESVADFVVEPLKTPAFSSGKRLPFWGKGISIPVSVLAVFILLVIGLIGWLSLSKYNRTGEIAVENIIKKPTAKTEAIPEDVSIARFDKGGRAEIYVVSRGEK